MKDNLYIITGSGAEDQTAFSGGNAAVFITDAGVTLVDTKLPGYGPDDPRAGQDRHQQAGHAHHQHPHARRSHRQQRLLRRHGREHRPGEHQGEHGEDGRVQGRQGASSCRSKTYKDKLTLGAGKDQIDLYYFGRGHTNGDTFVVFPALRTMHVGDMFAWKALPYVDPDNGGSVVEQPKTLAKAVADRQERGHDHQRAHSGGDLERPEGVRGLHARTSWRSPRRR